MIVVCGQVAGIPSSGHARGVDPAGIAEASARAGAPVQLIAVVPDGSDGDALLFRLAQAGVGHVAVLRSAARPLEPADVDLALRYLPDTTVVVAVGLADDVLAAATEQASWGAATLVVVEVPGSHDATSDDSGSDASTPDGAIVLGAPASDPDGTFAGFVGAFAARLDGGATPADAWNATTRALAVDAIRR